MEKDKNDSSKSFDHVKVGPTPVLVLHNLWRQMHMFLDILEFRVEKKTKSYFEKNCFGNVVPDLWKMAKIVFKLLRKKMVSNNRTFMGLIFAVMHFVTPFTNVSRHPQVSGRKHKKMFRENCFENMISEISKKK